MNGVKLYRISDFADLVGKHANTVDRWFIDMEKRNIHYVNRSEDGVKVYDDLDLSIAQFIRDRRDENWNLPAIYNKLEELFDLRPFPVEGVTGVPQVADFDSIRSQFAEEMKQVVSNELSQMVEGIFMGYLDQIKIMDQQLKEIKEAQLQLALTNGQKTMRDNQQRITDMITMERIRGQLRKEAYSLWAKKPESERIKRIGIFGLKKEEDHAERDRFIQGYIDDHLPERLAQEYGIE